MNYNVMHDNACNNACIQMQPQAFVMSFNPEELERGFMQNAREREKAQADTWVRQHRAWLLAGAPLGLWPLPLSCFCPVFPWRLCCVLEQGSRRMPTRPPSLLGLRGPFAGRTPLALGAQLACEVGPHDRPLAGSMSLLLEPELPQTPVLCAGTTPRWRSWRGTASCPPSWRARSRRGSPRAQGWASRTGQRVSGPGGGAAGRASPLACCPTFPPTLKRK
jgi:hypothetical protein